ncbi:cobalamin biosynthesis protein [Allofranklinella schreckenbergeri]|nr:cobalamin biosynthesis protein [Allofranklinella schreckenbergeri]
MPTPSPPGHATALRITLGVGLRAQARADDVHTLWQQARQALCHALQQASPPHSAGEGEGEGAAAPLMHQLHIVTLAALTHKCGHPALRHWLADAQDWHAPQPPRLLAVPVTELPAQPVHTRSAHMLARYGSGSVAEACALWAAALLGQAIPPTHGPPASAAQPPRARLLLPRIVAANRRATLAVAMSAADAQTLGAALESALAAAAAQLPPPKALA